MLDNKNAVITIEIWRLKIPLNLNWLPYSNLQFLTGQGNTYLTILNFVHGRFPLPC